MRFDIGYIRYRPWTLSCIKTKWWIWSSIWLCSISRDGCMHYRSELLSNWSFSTGSLRWMLLFSRLALECRFLRSFSRLWRNRCLCIEGSSRRTSGGLSGCLWPLMCRWLSCRARWRLKILPLLGSIKRAHLHVCSRRRGCGTSARGLPPWSKRVRFRWRNQSVRNIQALHWARGSKDRYQGCPDWYKWRGTFRQACSRRLGCRQWYWDIRPECCAGNLGGILLYWTAQPDRPIASSWRRGSIW